MKRKEIRFNTFDLKDPEAKFKVKNGEIFPVEIHDQGEKVITIGSVYKFMGDIYLEGETKDGDLLTLGWDPTYSENGAVELVVIWDNDFVAAEDFYPDEYFIWKRREA